MSKRETRTSAGRGLSEGSRKTQFSKDRQPAKRRQRKPRKDLKSGWLEKLQTPVSAQVNGRAITLPFIDALNSQLMQKLLKADLPDMLRFFSQLEKLGVSARLTEQAKIDEERLQRAGTT
jgi:hypothetical protein